MITYQYNHRMWVNLVKCASVELPAWVADLDDVRAWINPTVVKINEMFLVTVGKSHDDWDELRALTFDPRRSRSRLESMDSHVHMTSLLGENIVEPLVLLQAGLAVGDGMMAACARWPEEPFFYSVAYDETECTARFWKEREGEAQLSADLEGYRLESVLTAQVYRREGGESSSVAQSLVSIPRWVRRHLNQRQI